MNRWLGSGGRTKPLGPSTSARRPRAEPWGSSSTVMPPMRWVGDRRGVGRVEGGARDARPGPDRGRARARPGRAASAGRDRPSSSRPAGRRREDLDAAVRRASAKASCSWRARFTQSTSSKSRSSQLVGVRRRARGRDGAAAPAAALRPRNRRGRRPWLLFVNGRDQSVRRPILAKGTCAGVREDLRPCPGLRWEDEARVDDTTRRTA